MEEPGGGISPTVPDGSTVTPINDVETWLSCAGLNDTGYTTLAEVLTDIGVLQTLINNNNAMDYLVRCKNWINNDSPLVPQMTSDTTPSGEVFGNVYSGYPLYRAFDRNSSTNGIMINGIGNCIGYKFTTPTLVNKVFANRSSSGSDTYKFQGSIDGVNYTDIDTIAIANGNNTLSVDNDIAYTYYRLYQNTKAISDSGISFYEIQFYMSLLSSERAMYFIGQNNYAANTLLADPDWLDAIADSEYVEYVLNAKVPIMTSSTDPSGQVFCTTPYSTYYGYYAFDANDNTMFYSGYVTNANFIGYQFSTKIKAYLCRIIRSMGNNSSPLQYVLYVDGSDDGSTYTQISDTETVTLTNNYMNNKDILLTPTEVTHLRLHCGNTSNQYSLMVFELQFYGRTDV